MGVVVTCILYPMVNIYKHILMLEDVKHKYSQTLIDVKDKRIEVYEEKERLRKEIADAGVEIMKYPMLYTILPAYMLCRTTTRNTIMSLLNWKPMSMTKPWNK